MEKNKTEEVLAKTAACYSKSAILASSEYAEHRDVLNVVLAEDKKYTKDEIKKQLNSFLNKPISEKKNGKGR